MSSPLTSIIGAVELMKRKGEPDDRSTTRYHDLILKSAERIKKLTEDYGDGITIDDTAPPEKIMG